MCVPLTVAEGKAVNPMQIVNLPCAVIKILISPVREHTLSDFICNLSGFVTCMVYREDNKAPSLDVQLPN